MIANNEHAETGCTPARPFVYAENDGMWWEEEILCAGATHTLTTEGVEEEAGLASCHTGVRMERSTCAVCEFPLFSKVAVGDRTLVIVAARTNVRPGALYHFHHAQDGHFEHKSRAGSGGDDEAATPFRRTIIDAAEHGFEGKELAELRGLLEGW